MVTLELADILRIFYLILLCFHVNLELWCTRVVGSVLFSAGVFQWEEFKAVVDLTVVQRWQGTTAVDRHEPNEVMLEQASSSWGRKTWNAYGGWPELYPCWRDRGCCWCSGAQVWSGDRACDELRTWRFQTGKKLWPSVWVMLLREGVVWGKALGALMGWRMGFGCVTKWAGMTYEVVGLGVVFAREACDCALSTAYPMSETWGYWVFQRPDSMDLWLYLQLCMPETWLLRVLLTDLLLV